MTPSRLFTKKNHIEFWGLWLILLLGFALRLHTAWEWNTARPNTLTADEPGYDNLARDLLRGYGFTWPGRVPLYPAWLAFIYLITDGSIVAVRWAQVFWGVVVLLLTYVLARRIFGYPGGLIAAFLGAISYILIHQSARLLSESLYTPVLLLSAIALWDAFHKPSFWGFAGAGALIGISNLIRPTMFLFPFFLALILLAVFGYRRAWRYIGAFLLASTLIVAPWMIRNYLRYHAIYPLATSNAILWQGSPEYYHLIRDQGYTYLDVWEKVIYGPDGKIHDPGSVEGDYWWTQRALRSIAAEPLVYLKFCLEKTITYWVGDPNADWGDSFIFNYRALRGFGFSRAIAVQYMIARALIVPALVSALVLRKKWRTLLPIYSILGFNTLLHAITHAEARLSEPLQPFLLVLIAGALSVLFARANKQYLRPLSGLRSQDAIS